MIKLFKSFLYVLSAALVAAWFYGFTLSSQERNYVIDPGSITETSPPCLQMFYLIDKYAEEYNIPRNYAFGIANTESGYKGPFHWAYTQSLTSSAGAVGAMQIMPQYAHPYVDGPFTRDQLRDDIEMNVKASMRILRKLRDKHGDWQLAFGAYNTGRPCVNGYAVKVANYKPDF